METQYSQTEFHLFQRFGKNILFNVETMLFYEVTPLVRDLVTKLSTNGHLDPVKILKEKYPTGEIEAALAYLVREGFIKEGPERPVRPTLKKRGGIRHLELMVTHACNLGCRYCYGTDGPDKWKGAPHLYGARSSGMSLETARRGVDFLFEAAGAQKGLSVIFFGGEPLLEVELIERLLPYVREQEKEREKKVNLSLSTNGLLLTEKVVRFLVKNHIGCQVSIDGPRAIQDANRCLPDGGGSYDLILPGIRRLIAARKGKVPSRVTVAHGHIEMPQILEHLLSLGFDSVHIEPAIGTLTGISVTREDVAEIKGQIETLALFLVKSLKNNRYFNFSNLVKYIRQTRVIRERSAHYCGAGRTYLALSQEGAFYPCHRFVGLDEYRMGDLDTGIDLTLQKKILDLTVDNRPVCRDCWARYLCGGGCWKHAVDLNGGLEVPHNDYSCEIIRHEIECAMAVNSELKVGDEAILSDLYEKSTEPYLVTEN
jgi:uncharacterized protein